MHFTNLQRLDLGRNNLTALGNLPAGLVALSCAANELSGESNQFFCCRSMLVAGLEKSNALSSTEGALA